MFQSKKIFESDLQMLHSTLFESIYAAVVFDPEEAVAKNVNGDLIFISTEEELKLVAKTAASILLFIVCEDAPKIDLTEFAALVSIPKLKTKNHTEIGIHHFPGTYNTIRFAFPSSLKKPLFYNLKGEKFGYPDYKQIADKLFMSMGLNSLVTTAKFFAYAQESSADKILTDFFIYAENYVFTKQASFFEVVDNEVKSLVKHADSDYAKELNDVEARTLKGLEPLIKSDKLVIPRVLEYKHFLKLNNNYPIGSEMTDQLEDLHLEALNEIYKVNKNAQMVGHYLQENNYLSLIKAFKLILTEDLHPKGISRQHIEDIAIDLITLMNRLNPKEPIFTSLFHGAFEPANCLKKNDVLYLNNFDKCEPNKPLLFDAFHYIFHRLEAEQAPVMGQLDDVMKYVFKNKSVIKMIEEHDINFKLNLALFHIHHIIGKVESFMKQRFINPNVNFTLKFYIDALERMNSISI